MLEKDLIKVLHAAHSIEEDGHYRLDIQSESSNSKIVIENLSLRGGEKFYVFTLLHIETEKQTDGRIKLTFGQKGSATANGHGRPAVFLSAAEGAPDSQHFGESPAGYGWGTRLSELITGAAAVRVEPVKESFGQETLLLVNEDNNIVGRFGHDTPKRQLPDVYDADTTYILALVSSQVRIIEEDEPMFEIKERGDSDSTAEIKKIPK